MTTPQKPMGADDTWSVYARLWERCRACGPGGVARAFVHYVEPEEARLGEAGYFRPHAREPGPPEIAIVRRGCGLADRGAPTSARRDGKEVTQDELLAEICNLAHELGHARSWREGRRTADYEEAALAFEDGLPLRDRQQQALLKEEELAWTYARLELEDVGFRDWARFESMRTCGLDAYRQTFWPTAR